MTTPRNKTQLLNWAVTSGRIKPHMRHTWATRFVLDDPAAVERTLLGLLPSGRTPDAPVPRPWASVAASVAAGEPPPTQPAEPEPTEYPTEWLHRSERNTARPGRVTREKRETS